MSAPSLSKTILFVSGFSTNLRAKDLAYEFERYGRLIRCDIPALKSPTSAPYAFIEFRSEACAEDAYFDMHGRSIDGRRISIQWAKNSPGNSWRHEPGSGGPPRGRPNQERDSRRRSRSRSPVAASSSSRRDAPRERERSRSRSPVASSRREGSSAREGSEKKERVVEERELRDREEDEGRKRRERSDEE
ncbi:hypothetical protein BDY24DRAFT_393773 [Mrakia frigida]|uniref:uncharacterized protein n=1 Tax=Mrakia frigida TaxID=29902 RepID=UPI003FCC1239